MNNLAIHTRKDMSDDLGRVFVATDARTNLPKLRQVLREGLGLI